MKPQKIIFSLFLIFLILKIFSQPHKILNQNNNVYRDWESKAQPQFIYKTNTSLNNFYCYKNIFFGVGIKALFDRNNNIVIAGIDDSKRQIHLQKRNMINSNIEDYYAYNPFADSLNILPDLTSFNLTADSNKFITTNRLNLKTSSLLIGRLDFIDFVFIS